MFHRSLGATVFTEFCCALLACSAAVSPDFLQGRKAAEEFSKYSIVKPRLYHGREQRSIPDTRETKEPLTHVHDLMMTVNINGHDHILDLTLNRDLLPKNHFIRSQRNGTKVVHRPQSHEIELCQYQGDIRGVKGSWAAISTCNGIRGAIYDGRTLHYIERGDDTNVLTRSLDGMEHFLYSHNDLVANHSCGYDDTPAHARDDHMIRLHRYKRSGEVIRGPYNANRTSRYVELVLVVDSKAYKSMGCSLSTVHTRCKDIANIINALYVPLNIFIALVGVVVWTETDEINLSPKGDTTLTNFLHYRRERLVKDHPNDNAQLLTKVHFDGGVVGKALKGPICTFEFSGGVSMDHSPVVALVATTVAHEMGHNFGMEHDGQNCQCPDDRCIMAPSSSSLSPTHWSSCSKHYLALAFEHGMDYCLRNKPEKLFDSPVCGNGFVEVGEQCDCGLKNRCDNPCCNASTCMLFPNASCATGECCDLTTCHPKVAGSMCRSADHECDLPEYCTGHSEFCPGNVFKMDGETCNKGEAFCYQGTCRSHTDQCQLLWGPSGKSSDNQCYKMNTKGSRHGNCGYNRLNQSFIKCCDENIYCGMLHCIHLNERLEFGMESVAILSHSFINSGGSVIPCRTVIVDLGLNEVDPGLAPDGAKCAEGKMCVGQKCLSIEDLSAGSNCLNNCNGNGVCNSLGHCHCNAGFAPPYCHDPGTGGSEDSGPATQPNARREVINAFYIIFLGIVPSVALVSLLVYYLKRNTLFWKKPRTKISEKKIGGGGGGHPRVSKGPAGGTKAFRVAANGVEISGPLIVDHSRASLLPKCDTNGQQALASSNDSSPVTAALQNNLLGQYKGFSISPIAPKPQEVVNVPTRPAPTVHKQATQKYSLPKVPANVVGNSVPVRPAPKVPPTHQEPKVQNQLPPELPPANQSSRIVISPPVLDTTTSCTAKELIGNPPTPSRIAPGIPESSPKPDKTLDRRSLSVASDDKKPKDNSYPTLTRIASFMRGQKNVMSGSPVETKKVEPPKKQKIDRETLRNLEISNPIPQKEIEIPQAALLPAGDKNVVMRAQSMRDGQSAGKRAPIPTFGSMRIANKRPTSIPVSNRPKSPPPPRPPSIGLPGYQTPTSPPKPENTYDDCLNLLTEGVAPLANIDEESPGSVKENIYAVIEESPVDNRGRKLSNKSETTSPSSGEYKVPRPIEDCSSMSTGNSSESMGLLGEIVSEIQARNTESIYSSSTLKRKKELGSVDTDDDTKSTDVSSFSDSKSNQTYVNTPWKGGYSDVSITPKSSTSSNSSNSGYLSPINSTNKNFVPSQELNSHVKLGPTVPESSAPSYKPFSSNLQKHPGQVPISVTNKSIPSQDQKGKLDTKPSFQRTKTPPKLGQMMRTKTPPSLSSGNRSQANSVQKNKTPTEGAKDVEPKLVKPSNVKSQNSFISPKPDLVSSCAKSEGLKSPPDVLGKHNSTSKISPPNKGGGSRQPMPAPKPSNNKSFNNKLQAGGKPDPKTDTAKTVVDKLANRSSVALLQQKFESSNKPIIQSKSNMLENKGVNVKR